MLIATYHGDDSRRSSVVVTARGVGPAGIVAERSGRVLLDGFIDRTRVREHDLDAGVLQPILDRQTHPSGDHGVAVANGVHQIVVATAMPRIRVVTLGAGADLAEFPIHFDAVFEVDDNKGLRSAEVSGDGVPVQSGKCDSHGLQDTVDSEWTRKPIPRASSESAARLILRGLFG